MRHTANNTHRLQANPKEQVFSNAWKVFNNLDENALSNLSGISINDVTQEHATLAASIIQWLGSPVVQHFLTTAELEIIHNDLK